MNCVPRNQVYEQCLRSSGLDVQQAALKTQARLALSAATEETQVHNRLGYHVLLINSIRKTKF